MEKWYRIDGITAWKEDLALVANAPRGWDGAVQRLVEKERVSKIENGEAEGLPFVCQAESETEAIGKYNREYCTGGFIKAAGADCKEVRKFAVSLQVDCRVEVEVFATDANEAGKLAQNKGFETEDLEMIETHCVNATDVETGELTDLY